MIASIFLGAVLVPFLGVAPPRGYVYSGARPVPQNRRAWTIGVTPHRSEIGVAILTGYSGSSRAYAEKVVIPGIEQKRDVSDFELYSSRVMTVCGTPGWEMRDMFRNSEGERVQVSIYRATAKYVILADYQRPRSVPEDPHAIAAMRKLCPPTLSKRK